MVQQQVKFTTDTRDLIIRRAGSRCELCGAYTTSGQIHHRQPRGMGGSKKAEIGGAANGIYLHPSCHASVESNREMAYEQGWLVRRPLLPADTPIRLWRGWVWLTDEGAILSEPPKGEKGEP